MVFIKIMSCCFLTSYAISHDDFTVDMKEKEAAMLKAYDLNDLSFYEKIAQQWNDPEIYYIDGSEYRLSTKERAKRLYICNETNDRNEFFFYVKRRPISIAVREEIQRRISATALCDLSAKEIISTLQVTKECNYIILESTGRTIIIAEGISIEVYKKDKKIVKEIAKAIFEAGLVK